MRGPVIAHFTTPVLVAALAATLAWAVFQTIVSDGHQNRADANEILLDQAEELADARAREVADRDAEIAALQTAMIRAEDAARADRERAATLAQILTDLNIAGRPDANDPVHPLLVELGRLLNDTAAAGSRDRDAGSDPDSARGGEPQ